MQFSGQPGDFADQPMDRIDIHLIVSDGVLAGMFRIDRDFSREHDFVQPGTYGLRSMIVDARQQGQGIGTAMIRALPAHLAQHYPQAESVFLTVNKRNPAARRSYLRGGFVDTGKVYAGGQVGPQDILRMDLS